MQDKIRFLSFPSLGIVLFLLQAVTISAEPVPARYIEGTVHGFLKLSSMDGVAIAEGDLIQISTNDRVTNRLVFRFKDGSARDEIAVFSQHGAIRLLNYRLVQKGRSFQPPMDMSFESSAGEVTVRYTDDNGKEKVVNERMNLPPDLANGLLITLLKNVSPDGPTTTVSMVAATPKPRLVKLAMTPQGQEPFVVSGLKRMATHYVLKVQIGGWRGRSLRW
jgi:hypothetical protein